MAKSVLTAHDGRQHYLLGCALWSLGTGSTLAANLFEMMGHYYVDSKVLFIGVVIGGLLGLLIFHVALALVHLLMRPSGKRPFSTLAFHVGVVGLPMAVVSGIFTALIHLEYLQLSSSQQGVILFVPVLFYPLYVWALEKASPMPDDVAHGLRPYALLVAGIWTAVLSGFAFLMYSMAIGFIWGRLSWFLYLGTVLLMVSISLYLLGIAVKRLRPLAVSFGWVLGASVLITAPVMTVFLTLLLLSPE